MLGWVLALLGLGALVAAVVAVVVGGLLLGPLLVWLSWNVLGLAHAVGAGELGFWGLVLAAVFLAVGLAGRVLIVGVVFLIDPAWLHRSATLHWPAPDVQELHRHLPAAGGRQRLVALPWRQALETAAREGHVARRARGWVR